MLDFSIWCFGFLNQMVLSASACRIQLDKSRRAVTAWLATSVLCRTVESGKKPPAPFPFISYSQSYIQSYLTGCPAGQLQDQKYDGKYDLDAAAS